MAGSCADQHSSAYTKPASDRHFFVCATHFRCVYSSFCVLKVRPCILYLLDMVSLRRLESKTYSTSGKEVQQNCGSNFCGALQYFFYTSLTRQIHQFSCLSTAPESIRRPHNCLAGKSDTVEILSIVIECNLANKTRILYKLLVESILLNISKDWSKASFGISYTTDNFLS
jgi:hypothetical protein